jgi:hypothetical protein
MNRFRMATACLALIASLMAGCDATPTVVDVKGVAVDLAITIHDAGMGVPEAPGSTVTLDVGQSVSLGAVATNALGLAVGGVGVTWSTSNASVAEVSSDGVVTAVGEGTAEIQAEAGELSATVAVVVAAAAL